MTSHDRISKSALRLRGRIPRVADSGIVPPPLPPPLPPQAIQSPVLPQKKSSGSNACLILAIVIPLAFVIVSGILAAILLPALARARESARRASCQNNLKQMGLVFTMYANENEGKAWPPSCMGTHPVVAPGSVFPEYLVDPGTVHCPSDADSVDPDETPTDQMLWSSYVYFGYALTTEDEMLAFIEACPKFYEEADILTQDLPAPKGRGSFGGDTFVRLRADLPHPEKIPVLFDNATGSEFPSVYRFNHIPGGGNILYMDGHTEFVKYPGTFPMSKNVLPALGKLQDFDTPPEWNPNNEPGGPTSPTASH